MKKFYTTPLGCQRIRERLDRYKKAYMKVCESNEEAAAAGDNCVWHDNYAYEENQRQMHQLARQIRETELVLQNIELVPATAVAPDRVVIGASVLICDQDGREQELFIAGYEDGDPEQGRISYTSPLGRALLGREEGDTCSFRVGGTVKEFEILEILAAPEKERIMLQHGEKRHND